MNKNRKPLPSQTRKKQAKEIKKAQKTLSQPKKLARTDTLEVKESLKKYPPKNRKAKAALIDSVVEGMEIKKKRKKAAVSKRTNPEEVDFHESPRAYAHREGARWEKTLVKQNVGKAKSLVAKMAKRASKSPTTKRKK